MQASALVVAAFSAFVIGLGLYGLVRPARLIAVVGRWKSKTGLRVVAILRIAIGAAFWLAAPASRAPLLLYVLAAVSIVSGIALALLGYPRYEALLSWWSRQSTGFVRGWCLANVAIASILLWAVVA